MNKAIIYTRTDKGERVAASASRELANDLRKVLDAVDGTSSVDALQHKLKFRSAGWLDRSLAALVADDLIREAENSMGLLDFAGVQSPPQTDDTQRKALELRAKIQARRDGPERLPQTADAGGHAIEEQARREVAERARREAEAQAQKLAEEKALRETAERARQEAEAQARRMAEEQARREAKEKARRDAEETARREAEEAARREKEETARREAERARREAEAQARRMVEEQAQREAKEKAQREAEEAARRAAEEAARRAAEEAVRRAAEEAARREAEETARREAELARQEAEAQERRMAEEQVRREAEEAARREADKAARRAVEEAARREAEEAARHEAEEAARCAVEEQARRKAEEAARRESEVAARRKGEEAARHEAERVRLEAEAKESLAAEEKAWREEQEAVTQAMAKAKIKAIARETGPGLTTRTKWGKLLALGIAALLVIGLAAIHLISFDGQIPQFEKLLAGQFQQPVKIQALRLSLVPQRHLRLEGVSIGSEGQIRIPRLKAIGELGNLFGDKKVFTSLELDSPVVTETGLGWILFGKPLARDVMFGEIKAVNAGLQSNNLSLPAFDAKLMSDGDSAWKAIVIESADQNLAMELTPKDGSVLIEFKARSFKIPFGSGLTLEDLVASGVANKNELAVTEFKGFTHGGILGGKARLKWGTDWSLAGELNAKQIDTSRLLPSLVSDGRLVGAATYAMQAPAAAKLFAANRVEGSFQISRGTLLGVDMGRMLLGGGMTGETRFAEITGSFVHDRGATQLRQVRVSEGSMSANGTAEVDANDNVSGRLVVELKMAAEQRRVNLALSGTLKKIEWRRP